MSSADRRPFHSRFPAIRRPTRKYWINPVLLCWEKPARRAVPRYHKKFLGRSLPPRMLQQRRECLLSKIGHLPDPGSTHGRLGQRLKNYGLHRLCHFVHRQRGVDDRSVWQRPKHFQISQPLPSRFGGEHFGFPLLHNFRGNVQEDVEIRMGCQAYNQPGEPKARLGQAITPRVDQHVIEIAIEDDQARTALRRPDGHHVSEPAVRQPIEQLENGDHHIARKSSVWVRDRRRILLLPSEHGTEMELLHPAKRQCGIARQPFDNGRLPCPIGTKDCHPQPALITASS